MMVEYRIRLGEGESERASERTNNEMTDREREKSKKKSCLYITAAVEHWHEMT